MKLLAIGTATSWVLLGISAPPGSSYVQYGALGLLAFVIVWACTRGFPALLTAQKAERDALLKVIDELKAEIRVLNAQLRSK